MKMTYSQIINAVEGLQIISEKELDYTNALKVSKSCKEIQKHLDEYNEEFNKLRDKYIETDEEGNPVFVEGHPDMYKLKDDMVDEYHENLKKLNDFEVDVTIYQIDPETLSDIKISPNVLGQIEFLICEEDRDDD